LWGGVARVVFATGPAPGDEELDGYLRDWLHA
jgi:hypothetical protein